MMPHFFTMSGDRNEDVRTSEAQNAANDRAFQLVSIALHSPHCVAGRGCMGRRVAWLEAHRTGLHQDRSQAGPVAVSYVKGVIEMVRASTKTPPEWEVQVTRDCGERFEIETHGPFRNFSQALTLANRFNAGRPANLIAEVNRTSENEESLQW